MFTQIRPLVFVAGIAAMLMGCSPEASTEASGGGVDVDMGGVGDLAPVVACCPAAQGVEGDVLLCADFAKIQTLKELEEAGWNFNRTSTPGCWEIREGNLANGGMFAQKHRNCFVTTPAIDMSDYKYAKYNRIHFLIDFKIDIRAGQMANIGLNAAESSFQKYITMIMLDSGRDDNRDVYTSFPRTHSFSLKKKEMPDFLKRVFQVHCEVGSDSIYVKGTGWQISSLAIVGSY